MATPRWFLVKKAWVLKNGVWKLVHQHRGPPGSINYLTPGTYQFIVPDDIYDIDYVVVAAGGGGGCGYWRSGGGGGSGGWERGTLKVTPGQIITVVVGLGGSGGYRPGDYGTNGVSGENSSFGSVVCTGGKGGVTGGKNNYPNPIPYPQNGSGGPGGLPNGVNGSYAIRTSSSNNIVGKGGNIVTNVPILDNGGYGDGGDGGDGGYDDPDTKGWSNGVAGKGGAVLLSW